MELLRKLREEQDSFNAMGIDYEEKAFYDILVAVAGDGQVHGLFRCAADYCKRLSANIRIDTHANNATMQRQIEKNGFRKCGIIYVSDGSPRLAYQWSASDNCR